MVKFDRDSTFRCDYRLTVKFFENNMGLPSLLQYVVMSILQLNHINFVVFRQKYLISYRFIINSVSLELFVCNYIRVIIT